MKANAIKDCVDRPFSPGVLYLNAGGLRNKSYELETLANKLGPLVVDVIETWLVHGFDITSELAGYHYPRSDRYRC